MLIDPSSVNHLTFRNNGYLDSTCSISNSGFEVTIKENRMFSFELWFKGTLANSQNLFTMTFNSADTYYFYFSPNFYIEDPVGIIYDHPNIGSSNIMDNASGFIWISNDCL